MDFHRNTKLHGCAVVRVSSHHPPDSKDGVPTRREGESSQGRTCSSSTSLPPRSLPPFFSDPYGLPVSGPPAAPFRAATRAAGAVPAGCLSPGARLLGQASRVPVYMPCLLAWQSMQEEEVTEADQPAFRDQERRDGEEHAQQAVL
ncbi:hypothetical protein BHM03_00001635 [Ensete ventricosum]|nr:hypothetical protein BHM03_00001635 [Ensete ventricosum]